MRARGLDDPGEPSPRSRSGAWCGRSGNRIMWGIARVSTVTPHALVSAALLSHPGRGLPARIIASRVEALRGMAAEDGSPLSAGLAGAPTDPTVPGPVREAITGFVPPGEARTRAQLLVAAMEGALILSRIRQSTRPILDVAKLA